MKVKLEQAEFRERELRGWKENSKRQVGVGFALERVLLNDEI